MSLPRFDYRTPITVPVIAIHPETKEARVVHLDLLWEHVLSVQEEPFPDGFKQIVDKFGGISIIKTVYATYHVGGTFREYHSAWMAYKKWEIKRADQYKLNFSAN